MKKFLSLVLAMIMTMSLVTISAGATEYKDLTDKDEIQYEEAVAVLNRIGVITGYDDGSFRPEGELTRGAAAKIIVSLLIGPEAANNLPNATAPYPDVPASHTFAGVISYCKTAKIISGYGDGTFKPGNSLTGFAFAKMLLGALGYKQEIEGFVDTGWTMNVAKVGNVVGLFDRLDFDGSASVNREEACQLALNTLKATMVTYGGTTMVTGAQNMFVQGTQAMYVTSNNREINANINRRVINATNNELTLEFGEEHFKDLRLEHDKYDPAYDDYGHPSNEWSWKKVTIGTFKLPADFTYTNQVAYREDTVATKEKALGLRGYDTYSTDHRGTSYNWSSALGGSYTGVNSPFADATQITVNGWNARVESATTGTLVNYDAYSVKSKDGAPTLSEIADLTDNGVTVEVYVCPVDADFITNVVVTRTQLMEVKRIGSDYVTLDRQDPDSRDPRKDEDLKAITGYNAYAIDVDTLDVKDNNYDAYNTLKDLKAGDKVAVIPFTADQGKTWEVGEAYVPETVSGKLSDVGLYMNTSKRDGNATSITVGGTKYVINEWNLDMIDVKKAQINATRKDVTAYLASDGTVLWATEIGNSDAWMVVGDYYQAANTSGKVVWFAHGWTIGGEEVDVDLGTIRGEAEKYAPGELVHYALADGGTGEYKLEKPNVTGKSRLYGTGALSAWNEPIRKDDKDRATGEGIYNVAQFVQNAGGNAEYEIHPANSLIPLELYSNQTNKDLRPEYTAFGGAIFGNEFVTDAAGNVTITANDGKGHEWDYRSTTYKNDGVKFIYVSFDAVTGNVDYVSVRKDAQSVDHDELTQMNTRWKNVGTNVNNQNWVISPAEAYVNDDGNVEAVVIKCEPAVADLSNVVIVGEYVGAEYGKTGAETNPSNTSAREYWQGPNFNEKKTGYFKNGHNVGDIVVIRNTDANGVMDCKMFNGGIFENRNPDVFASKGISALKSAADATSKIAFYVGDKAGFTVKSQDGLTNLTAANAELMTDLKVEADDLGALDEFGRTKYAGLVKVAGAKWIDLRANRGSNEVESLSDLLDLDPATVELHVLLNAKGSTDNFRRAYAIVVLAGELKKSEASVGTMSMRLVDTANFTYVAPKADTTGSATNPWIFEVPTLSQNVTLEGLVTVSSSKIDSQSWTVNDFSVAADAQNRITFTAPATETGVRNIRWTVHVHDNDKDIRDHSETRYAQVKIKDVVPATVTVDPVGAATILPATGLKVGDTFALNPSAGYKYDAATGATGATTADGGKTFTITAADVKIPMIKDETPPVPGDTVKINVGTQAVTFHDAETDAVIAGLENVTGEVDVPTAAPLYVTASAGNAAIVYGAGNVPYNKAFKPAAVTGIRVVPASTPQIFGQVLNVDGEPVIGLVYDTSAIPAAASSGELVETLTTMKAQSGATPYYKVTLSDGSIVLLGGVWDGYAWGLKFRENGNAASEKAFLTALNNGQKLSPAISSETEFEAGYTTPVDPDPTTEATVKATVDLSATAPAVMATFSAYYGEDKDAVAPTLTEKQIADAITAALKGTGTGTETVTSVDLAKGEAKTSLNHTITFDKTADRGTAPKAGSYQNPTRLFKITIEDTVDGNQVFYRANTTRSSGPLGTTTVGPTLTGFNPDLMAALLKKDTVIGKAVTGPGASPNLKTDAVVVKKMPTKGDVNLPVLTEDIVLVPAVEFKGFYEKDMTTSAAPAPSVKLFAQKVESDKEITTTGNKYVQKGTTLILKDSQTPNTDPGKDISGKSATLKVNRETNKVTWDKYEEITFNFKEGLPACELRIHIDTDTDERWEVTYEGKVISGEKGLKENDEVKLGAKLEDADLVCVQLGFDGKTTYKATNAMKDDSDTGYTVKSNDDYNAVAYAGTPDAKSYKIQLKKAFKVDPTTSSPDWTAALHLNAAGDDLSDALGDPITAVTYVDPDSTIYLKITGGKGLKVEDTGLLNVPEIKLVHYSLDPGTTNSYAIYEVKVSGPVNSTTVATGVDLSSAAQKATPAVNVAGIQADKGKTKEFQFIIENVTGANPNSEITAEWKSGVTPGAVDRGLVDGAVKAVRTDAAEITITATATDKVVAGTATLTLYVDGIGVDVTFTIS